ncbi:hypothetical protein [Thiobacillus sedimenti]|uniref:Uncharacterized protein n=1 Tax=Thiobacillus sedimenti TaxID=3110231 RepID=A0ABZ1CHS3_9PROT|nr:hypothetical protein [Thiobacillus sp. SCUT-2]WRS38942.1 hypothetical protein VA613_13165 [Thiobacillus sp. SCUT-2]
MPSALDTRKVRCLDGLYYSFQMLRHHYAGLWESCCEIPSHESKLIAALGSAWGFIDALHRIREIAQAVPGLSIKHPEMQAFLPASSLADEYRHYIHHLRSELANDAPGNAFPVWGTLSWVDPVNPVRSHMAVLGTQVEGTHYAGCHFDPVARRWTSKVCLGLNGKSFNFDPAFEAAARFETFVLPFLDGRPAAPEAAKPSPPLISVDFIRGTRT